MSSTVITSDLLDKLDRFRSQATEELHALDLPEDLNISLRQSVDRAILRTVDCVLSKQSSIPLQQGGSNDYSAT
jgi:hypothetical protein